jgi:hypothetical protein
LATISHIKRKRRENERGAALVEFAIVLPLVVLLLMGIIDFGFGLSNLNSMRHGTRESVRRAVVADVGSDSTCIIASGSPAVAGDTKNLVCQIKAQTGLPESKLRVKVVVPKSHVEGEPLILCTQYPLESITGMFSSLLNNKTVHAEVHMRIEKTDPDGAIANFEELKPIGGSWSWCNA